MLNALDWPSHSPQSEHVFHFLNKGGMLKVPRTTLLHDRPGREDTKALVMSVLRRLQSNIKAAPVDILILTTGQMTTCNVKRVIGSDSPTENSHLIAVLLS